MEMELINSVPPPAVQVPQRPNSHSYHNLSRPNSLLNPEKEPIKFQINLVGAPAEVEQLIEHIKNVASQFLYHWKTFPIRKYLTYTISSSVVQKLLLNRQLQICLNPSQVLHLTYQ